MALYSYVKKQPKVSPISQTIHRFRKEASFLFSVFGLILVGNAVFPIVSYQLRYAPGFGKILSPLASSTSQEMLNAISVEAKEATKDYTLISSWFDSSFDSSLAYRQTETTHYAISIPKLGIENATVKMGGEDLKKALIHYPDTALPGSLGNAVVFGHSVLPQFFNPENYLTIFSTLYRLKEGDEISLDFDGIVYRYLVEDLFEVTPTDLSVLEQRYDRRALTLITCSPPGTYLRRLIIRARLID